MCSKYIIKLPKTTSNNSVSNIFFLGYTVHGDSDQSVVKIKYPFLKYVMTEHQNYYDFPQSEKCAMNAYGFSSDDEMKSCYTGSIWEGDVQICFFDLTQHTKKTNIYKNGNVVVMLPYTIINNTGKNKTFNNETITLFQKYPSISKVNIDGTEYPIPMIAYISSEFIFLNGCIKQCWFETCFGIGLIPHNGVFDESKEYHPVAYFEETCVVVHHHDNTQPIMPELFNVYDTIYVLDSQIQAINKPMIIIKNYNQCITM